VAGGTSGGAAGGVSRPDAGAPPPGPSTDLRLAASVELNGITTLGAGVVGAGTRRTTVSNSRDAALLRLGATPSASFVGGANNDQFYAVASRSTGALAVGLTRTFNSAFRNSDSALLVTVPLVGAPVAVVHENIGDVGLQPRAVDVTSTGYVVAGRFDGGTEGYVGLVTPAAQPTSTRRFRFPGVIDLRVRQVRVNGAISVVVGDAFTGTQMSGFVASFDTATLAARSAFLVSAPGTSVFLVDVASTGSTMVAVGQSDGDGLVLTFDAMALGPVTVTRVPLTRLASVVGPAPALVTGLRGSSLIAARLTPTGLEGTAFSALANPSNISPLPLLRTATGALVFGRTSDAGLAELELNADLRSGCNAAVSGTPFRVGLEPDAGVSVTTATPVVVPVSVNSLTVSGLVVTPLGLAPAAACWP
jgi:hypothetical protein